MGIILWIILGALVGYMASRVIKSNTRKEVLPYVLVGVVGAVVGGRWMSFIGNDALGGLTPYSFMIALLGASVLLTLTRVLRR